jgi:hypothetical protein
MTVRKHALKAYKHLSVPVSYKVLDDDFLLDARNVFDNKGITETRYGIKRYNTTSLNGAILSLSYFKHSNGTGYKLAKVGTVLYSVAASGAATAIKTGLSATTKHRAVTLNDRHIIAIEADGLFSFDGTIFTALGQVPPTTATAAVSAGGTLTPSINYQVGLTFYSSITGFESNVYQLTYVTTTAANKQIDISAIPATATNATIDKVRVYLKNMGTEVLSANAYLFVTELALGTTTYTITTPTISTIVPPTKNAPPLSGGAKYIALFGKKIAIAGNATYPSEVFISEEYLPDAFDGLAASQVVLQASGQGPITGIEVGFYDQQFLNPYLVLFKKTTTTIYSELNRIPSLVTLDGHVGCISHDTIKIRNGSVAFMGTDGWYLITNGAFVKEQNGTPARLGGGAIDDVFSRKGWTNEVNIPQSASFFSAYYSSDAHYMTFVSEGASTEIKKAYVYEERIGGFRVFDFTSKLTCATEAEDDNGYQTIMIGDTTGTIFTYSSRNSRSDEDYNGTAQSIPALVLLPYLRPGEDASTYNFRTLAVRALASTSPITVKTFPSFSLTAFDSFQYDFPNTGTGFILDSSQLDVDAFGDERTPVTYMADINSTGETIMIGFYQDVVDANISLISAQITFNKNGNRNL